MSISNLQLRVSFNRVANTFVFVAACICLSCCATVGQAVSINDGLIAHYTFDGTSGPVIDSTGSYNGTNHGVNRGLPGMIGNAFEFDGWASGDYVDTLPVNAIPTTSTISFWMYPTVTDSAGTQIFGSIANASGGKDGLILNYGNQAVTAVSFKNNRAAEDEGRESIRSQANSVPLDTWTHVTYSWDSSNGVRLYTNGQLTGTGDFLSSPSSHDRALMFGKSILSQNYSFSGLMDDVKIWDRALSAAEVASLQSVHTPLPVDPTTDLPSDDYLDRSEATTSTGDPRLIVFDAQGNYGPGGSIDPNKPTIVLSHGYNSSFRTWPLDIADSLHLTAGVDANIVAWNWEDDARPFGDVPLLNLVPLADLGRAGANAPRHGTFLGEALLEELGQGYDQTIHFIGHSLGTRVSKVAADLLHDEGFAADKTHVTILDAAEASFVPGENLIPWSNPIPEEEVGYIDNYITFSGQPHAEAVNVQLFVDQNNLNAIEFHSLPTEWYLETIGNNIANPVGHYRSFEAAGVAGAPSAGAHYYQLNQPSDGEPHQKLSVASQSQLEASAKQIVRDLNNYPGVAMAAVDLGISAVRAVGDVTADVVRDFSDNAISSWLSVGLTSASPAYAWVTIEVPEEARLVSFDVLFDGLEEGDFFAFGVDDTLLLSLDSSLIEDGLSTNVGFLDVSMWSGIEVDFFYGLETPDAGKVVTIDNFVIMSPVPEPSTLTWDNQGGMGDYSWATAANWDPDHMPNVAAETTMANGDTVLLDSPAQEAKSVSVENGSALHITTTGQLTVAEGMAIESSSKLEIDVSGSASGRADVTGLLQLDASASLVLDWVPTDPSSKFGGDYVIATYGTRTGEFDSVGGGDAPYNISEAYVADVDYVTDDQITISLHSLLDGDADLDGDVDFGDYMILEAAFGDAVPTASAAAIPEPGTLAMLLGGLAGLVLLGGRKVYYC